MKKTLLACFSGVALLSSCSFGTPSAFTDASRSAVKVDNTHEIGSRKIISFDPQKDMIYNPDMGFYNAVMIKIYNRTITSNGQQIYENEIEKDKKHLFEKDHETGLKINREGDTWSHVISGSNFDLLNLKFDLSAFSSNAKDKDKNSLGGSDTELNEIYLKNCMDDILGKLEELGKTAFVGFAYCWYDPNVSTTYYDNGEKKQMKNM